MKTLLFLIMALVGLTTAQTIVRLEPNEGQSIPLMNARDIPVNLDTSEIDTSDRYIFTLDRGIRTFTDTIGRAWMRCDDSAGTDSVGGRLIWYGNPSPDPKNLALWEAMDSVSIAVASGVETQTSALVVNSRRYAYIRFHLRNQLAPGGSAAEKTVCRNIRLNVPRLLNPVAP